jgi:hypothetical protein
MALASFNRTGSILSAIPAIMAASIAFAAAQAPPDYLPLREGAEYVYAWNFDARSGTVTKRVKSLVIQNSTYFVFVNLASDGKESDLIAGNFPWDGPIRKTDAGIVGMNGYRINDRLWPKEDKPDLLLATPLKEGATAKALVTTITIEGFEDVEAGGKTFKQCARIRHQLEGNSAPDIYWLAPGVGMVKWQFSTGRQESLT